MSRILFLTDRYFPHPYANGICVHAVAESLVKAGQEVHVLAFEIPGDPLPKEKDGISIFGVKTDLANQMIFAGQTNLQSKIGKGLSESGKLLLKAEKLALFSRYPQSSLNLYKHILKEMEKLNEIYQYDVIIATYNPLDTLLAGKEFKKNHPDVLFGIYNLDFMPESIKRRVSEEKVQKSCLYWQAQLYPYADFILDLETNLVRWDNNYHTSWQEKIYSVGLPLLQPNQWLESKPVGEKQVWVYAGALDTDYYQIEDVLRIICSLPQKYDIEFHIYGRGSGYELCKNYESIYPDRVKVHGYVGYEELRTIYENADVLISMKKTDLVSGKTLEFISTGKRVIHFSGSEKDPNKDYFLNYCNSAVIRTDRSLEVIQDALIEVIEKWKEYPVQKMTSWKDFEKNLPDATRDVILSLLNRKS